MQVTTTIEIDDKRVADLLCTAFEGGIGYWAMIVGYKAPEKPWTGRDWKDPPRYVNYPLSDGGAVYLFDAEEEWEDNAVERLGLAVGDVEGIWVLDKAAIERGMALFLSPKWSHQSSRFLAENEDAEVADVFVQLCVLGEVVYG